MGLLMDLAASAFMNFVEYLPSPVMGVNPKIPNSPAAPNSYQPLVPPANIGKRIEAGLQDSWALLGIKGSGKTTLAKELVTSLRRGYPGVRTYYLDSKMAGDFDSIEGYHVESVEAPGPVKDPGGVQVWHALDDNIRQYHKWFHGILKARQPSIVLVDELSSLSNETATQWPLGYKLLLKQGRGLHICVISLTQDGAYIPRQVFGQLTHFIRFRLEDEYDQRKAAKKLKIEMTSEPKHTYGFFYRRVDRPGNTHEYQDWKDFLAA